MRAGRAAAPTRSAHLSGSLSVALLSLLPGSASEVRHPQWDDTHRASTLTARGAHLHEPSGEPRLVRVHHRARLLLTSPAA